MMEIFSKLCAVIPGGVNSPVRNLRGLLEAPVIPDRGEGDLVWDVAGKKYIDYCGSWGPLILGHAHPQVLEKVIARIRKGTSFGMTTQIEEELAAKVVQLIDAIEKVRFVSSGTEATMSAIRLARGVTGRKKIVKFEGNYHGHADFLLVKAGSGVATLPESSSSGVPPEMVENTLILPYNDPERAQELFSRYGEEIAAVIVEPIAGNMGVVPGTAEFLQTLRSETEEHGALLIFDEVISGFRVGLQGAQGLYGIAPDITCLGKIIGGGFPAAAFGGRAEIMDHLAPLGPVYQAGTLSGNPVAMEAGLQTLLLLSKEGFYEELARKTSLVTKPIKERGFNGCVQEVGSMFSLFLGRDRVTNFAEAKAADHERFVHLFRHLIARGIYIPPSGYETWFVSYAHTDEHLRMTSDAIIEFLQKT